jgi:hypothetical protein
MREKSDSLNRPPSFHPALDAPVRPPDIEDALELDTLPVGAVAEVETKHHTYRVEYRGDGKALVSGHPEYCPQPVLVDVCGSTLGGEIKFQVIQPGMRMLFFHPVFGAVSTSRVLHVSAPASVH